MIRSEKIKLIRKVKARTLKELAPLPIEKISMPGMSEMGAKQILLSHGCKPEKMDEYVKQLTERRDYTPSGLTDEERDLEIEQLMKKLGLK